MRIIIYLSDCEKVHYLPLMKLGTSLSKNGVDVVYLLCPPGPCPGCFSVFSEIVDDHCINNRFNMLKDAEALGISPIHIAGFIKKQWREEAAVLSLKIDFDNYESFEYNGFNLWEITRGSIWRYLTKPYITTGDIQVVREFYKSAILYLNTFLELYKKLSPDGIIVFNGMPYLDRIAREIASQNGINVIAEENSCFSDRKFLEPTGVVANRHSFSKPETWEKIVKSELSYEEIDKLHDYLKDVYSGRVNTIPQSATSSHHNISHELSFPPDKPLAILLGQVPFDSVIAYDSPFYSDILEFIKDVITIFSSLPEWGLIIRLHPIEGLSFGNPTLKRLENIVIPNNVRIVSGRQFNTYDLMDMAQFGLTINSQSGLEMLSKHKPVLLAGNAFYGRKGFTSDINSREDLEREVHALISEPTLNEKQKTYIDTYLYNFIFRYLIPYDKTDFSFAKEATERILNAIRDPKGLMNYTASNTIFEQCKELPEQVDRLYLSAKNKLERSDLDAAIKDYDSILDILESSGKEEESAEILLQKGILLLKKTDLPGAKEIFNRHIKLRPAGIWGYFNLGLCCRVLKEYDSAMSYFDMAESLMTDKAPVYFEKGLIYRMQGEYASSLHYFDMAEPLMTDKAPVYFEKGLIYRMQGEYASSLHYFDIAESLMTDKSPVYFEKGLIYRMQGEYASSLHYFDIAESLMTDKSPVYFEKGLIYRMQGEYASSLHYFDMAESLMTDKAPVFFEKGVVYKLQGDYRLALRYFDMAEALMTDKAPIYFEKGLITRNMGKFIDSIRYFNMLIEIEPEYYNKYSSVLKFALWLLKFSGFMKREPKAHCS